MDSDEDSDILNIGEPSDDMNESTQNHREIRVTVSWRQAEAQVQVVPTLTIASFCANVIRAQPGWEDLKVNKILFNGKRIDTASEASLADEGVTDGSILKLFGSSEYQLQQAQEMAANTQLESQLIDDRNDRSGQVRKKLELREKRPKFVPASDYGFKEIQEIPTLPDSENARDVLATIAMDPGVLAVMEKHRFKVERLVEMYPEGKVGISPTCVLGYNKNKGQEINLRLRTDDLRGFRPHKKILSVLWHELAHNVYSEHDENFYKLNRQLEEEGRQLDWRNKRGFKLGGSTINAPLDASGQQYHVNTGVRLGKQRLEHEKYQPFTATVSRERRPNVNPNEAAAEAALMRYHKKKHSEGDSFKQKHDDERRSSQGSECTVNTEANNADKMSTQQGSKNSKGSNGSCKSPAGMNGSVTNSRVPTATVVPYSSGVHERSETAHFTDSQADATYDRLRKLRETINEYIVYCKTYGYSVSQALRTTMILIQNAIKYSDNPKYRRFRWSNSTLQSRLGGKPPSVASLLRTAGFRPDTHDSDYWVFAGDDLASSWLVKDVIEQHLEGNTTQY